MNKESFSNYSKLIKIIKILFASIILLLAIIILFIRSPWGQDIIISKATTFISDKTQTVVTIDKLYLGFSGDLLLKGLYVEDQKNDTLVYSKKIVANVGLLSLIKGDEFNLKSLYWEGLKANVYRKDTITDFNYSFIVDAFSTKDTKPIDTTSTALDIKLGKLKLKDFDIKFKDQVLGIKSSLFFTDLSLKTNTFDLKNAHFGIDNISLANAKINYHQTNAFPESDTETTSSLPLINLDKLSIKNSTLNYISDTDRTKANLTIQELQLALPTLDLNKQIVDLEYLALNNSRVSLYQLTPNTSSKPKDSPTPFSWPTWQINAKKMALNNNQIQLKTGNTVLPTDIFNAENTSFKQLSLKAKNIIYKPANASAEVTKFSFTEQSGFNLQKLATQFELTDKHTTLKNLSVITGNNSLNGNVKIEYNSFEAFIKNPSTTKIAVTLPELKLNPKDAYYFTPDLKKNDYVKAIAKNNITGRISITGEIKNLNIAQTQLAWGKETNLDVTGRIVHPTEVNSLGFDIANLTFSTVKNDLHNFINPDTLGIAFPSSIKLNGTAAGIINNFKSDFKINMPEGAISFNGNFKNSTTIATNSSIDIKKLDLKTLLKNENLGIYSFSTKINAEGTSFNDLTGKLTTDFSKLPYNNYDFSALKINAELANGKGAITANYKDKNLDFDWNNSVELDSINSNVNSKIEVKGANLMALGFSKEDIRAKFNVESEIDIRDIEIIFKGKFTDALAVKNNKPFLLGDINLSCDLTEKNTQFAINSNPITASLNSNTDLANLTNALQKQFNAYFDKTTTAVNDSLQPNVNMQLKGSIKEAPILKNLFLPDLESLAPASVSIDFDSKESTLKTRITAPHVIYNGNSLDSLKVNINATKENLDFNMGVTNISGSAIDIKKINFDGSLKNSVLLSKLEAKNNKDILLSVSTEVTKKKDSTIIHIIPNKLVINKENWSLPSDNSILYTTNYLGLTNFNLTNNNQQIKVSNTLPQENKKHIGFKFSNFKLSTLTGLINQEKLVASGKLNGNFIIEDPFKNPGIVANATIQNLKAFEVPLGTFKLKATSNTANNYELNLGVKGPTINLDIDGNYKVSKQTAALDFDIDLKNLELNAIEEFASTYISKTSGSLNGNIKLTGTTSSPILNGDLKFKNSGLTINALNAEFKLPQEIIKLDNTGVYFSKFKMVDAQSNSLILDGKISPDELTNPDFDIHINAKNIQLLNSTKDDNSLFYGNVNLDTNITVKGDLELPIVTGKLMINESSNFTYVVPEDDVDLIEKKGVVLFVNKKNPDDILTKQSDESSAEAVLKGYDINTELSVSKKSVFNIIIDERTGDNLKVEGNGDFKFGISPNGDMSLSGKYEVNSGHYEASLYNIVKRRFDIAKGSTITWRGNPLEADMDVRAIYNVETAASGLMSSQISGINSSSASKYNQKLPFKVYLNLDGELLKPEISFNLDMPKDSQGEIGGEVYSQVQQLNTQEEQLNKQVFSLLVLNQFFPSSTSDGGSGGSLSIARDNANNVLSNQLNSFSNKLTGNTGIELDFGLDSYTDYQGNSPSNRTQLDVNARKKLLNDRLIVEVGSGININESSQNTQNSNATTPLVGTINIQYLFDDKGKWRLKAYRKNEFENFIDGQVILTGLSVLFNQEFNKFKDLFAKQVQEEVLKTKKATASPQETSTP